MFKKVYCVVEELQKTEVFDTLIAHIKTTYNIEPTLHSSNEKFDKSTYAELFLLYLSDEEVKIFLTTHFTSQACIGIIPNEMCPHSIKNYSISKDVIEAIDDAFNEELLSYVDILTCNEYLVLDSVVIGDMHGMSRLNFNEQSKWGKIKIFLII